MAVPILKAPVQMDYSRATAQCEVVFPKIPESELTEGENMPFESAIPIAFHSSARGCGATETFDARRNRRVLKLESKLTFFHGDDQRPAWLRGMMNLTGSVTPDRLPRPLSDMAARLMAIYGPGSFTVYNSTERGIFGEAVAVEEGEDGDFFPAYSYFDQWLDVKVVGRTFRNKKPLRVSSTVNRWPPEGETYQSEGITEFYDATNMDGLPVLYFGNCTIQIEQALAEEELTAMHHMIEGLRAQA